jgi:hypothetical protein
MFLDRASGRDSGALPRAALCGLTAEDEEVLELLLGILDWQCAVLPAITQQAAAGVQLIFVGHDQWVAVQEEQAFLRGVNLVLVMEAGSDGAHGQSGSGFVEVLTSPIDLHSAELIINKTSAEFLQRDAN